MIKLIGIVVVAAGFALRVNTLLVVLVAGIATGLVAGNSFNDIMAQFGTFFVENRYMTLPVVLMLPVIGMLERHGLQERAETLMRRTKAATAGRVLLIYTAVRQISISLGVNIGGHAGAVRPLIAPMAEAAARRQVAAPQRDATAPDETTAIARDVASPELSPAIRESIRAHAAAAENVGNFFGEDIFIAVGAVLLMKGFFDGVKIAVNVWALALWGLPTAVIAFAVMVWRTRVLDRRIVREAAVSRPFPPS
jgi:uncharacterized membrane protein